MKLIFKLFKVFLPGKQDLDKLISSDIYFRFMPKVKPKIAHGEKLAEKFFPVDETDVKYAVEKPASEEERYLMKSKPRRKKSKKKKKTRKFSELKFEPKKINLKPDGYELIITEKPQAATKIASALAFQGNLQKKSWNKVSYYEIERDKKKIFVACAVGHLFTLKQKVSGLRTPIFDIAWFPNYMVRKNDFSKKYYNTLLRLVKNAGSIIVATDYDVEGELIGLNVVRFIGTQSDAERMKFSTLTQKEINDAYEGKESSINWGQAIAGETRHYLDWYYGINLSRALMEAIKSTGSFKLMSSGRVQGPALNIIVKKEKQIQAFRPRPYWHVYIDIESKNKNKIRLLYDKDIFEKSKLKVFESLKGKTAEAKTETKDSKIKPNPPFNLTTLQTEAYRLYKIKPSETLQSAQSLYLAGLISYPRTSSQKLPPSIGYKKILEKLVGKYKVKNKIVRDKPIEGKKSDPAHPSIYPTGEDSENTKVLSKNENRIYDLIVKRFLALFMDDAVKEDKKISLEISGFKFYKKGSYLKEKGWAEIYPPTIKEKKFPGLNGEVKIQKVDFEEKETKPPRRYSPASIILELEKRNLGTKATRSSILETLYDRGYIQGQSIEATPLGISLIETLEKHSPIIIEEELTRDFEKSTEIILQSKKNLELKKEKVLKKARENIKDIVMNFKKKEMEIGKELLEAIQKFRERQRQENTLNSCPKCKNGNLTIKYSKKVKRYFVACDKYPECKNTYTLPPYGLMKPMNQECEFCKWPMIIAIRKGKRPWSFCFNPDCKTNKERIEAYRKK